MNKIIQDIRCKQTIIAVLRTATNAQLRHICQCYDVPVPKARTTKDELIRHLMRSRSVTLRMAIRIGRLPQLHHETHEIQIDLPVGPYVTEWHLKKAHP